jgi:Concanavalin A-like lectin/glucanases superfamily/Domain of unknown function (DUF4832)
MCAAAGARGSRRQHSSRTGGDGLTRKHFIVLPKLHHGTAVLILALQLMLVHLSPSPALTDRLSAYPDLVLADAPVAFWKLDDSDPQMMRDASGNGWNGVFAGGVWPVDGGHVFDRGRHFDGTSGTARAPLDLSGANAVTLEFWLSWDSFADNNQVAFEFSAGPGTFQTTDGFLVDPNSAFWPGQLEVSMGDGSGASYNSILFARPRPGEWHHYAIVLDRSAPPHRQIVPYLDGAPVSYSQPSGYNQPPATGHDRFANGTLSFMSRSGSGLFGAGALADVAVYPDVLPAARIAEHYRAATGTATSIADAVQSLAMRTIPLSAPEMPNPLRGEYQWYGESVDPKGWPYQDSYTRLYWKELEQAPDVYDFSKLDAALANAAARGGRFGFRIMSVCTGCDAGGVAVPDYVTTSSGGWYARVDGERNFIPDWNNANYLSRWQALMQALGARYGHDPRIGIIDIGGAGDWGEWHDSPYEDQYPGPQGQLPITDASARRIVDATLDAFPPADHLLVIRTANSAAVREALGRSRRVGLRLDCLGGGNGMAGDRAALARVADITSDRWQTAPVVSEWCGTIAPGTNRFQQFGPSQVQEFHVSMLSSGNYAKTSDGGLSGYSPAEQDGFITANKIAGYRFVLDSLTLPVTLPQGGTFTAGWQWENVNVAPLYLPFNVMVQLRDANQNVIWQAQSGFDPRGLLPTDWSPVAWTDNFTLGDVPPGDYLLTVQITDPSQISPPLQLAIEGRQSDGSYLLGSVSVR